MRIDGREIPATGLKTDICIIGGGAAGITLAMELLGSDRSVLLVESGGTGRNNRNQALYAGSFRSNYLPDSVPYLTASRVRAFGGSTGHWGGNCHPLDALDFTSRPWVPHSGWPITWADLAPYYDRSAPYVEITPFPVSQPDPDPTRPPLPLNSEHPIRTLRYHLSHPTHFGVRYGPQLFASRNVTVVLHANLLRLETDEAGRTVRSAQAAALRGRPFPIRARQWVLATGGIENARLLLLSTNPGHPQGLANNHDLVGRYFHDHVMAERSLVFINRPPSKMRLYRPEPDRLRGHRVHGLLALSADAQRQYGLMNLGAELRRTNFRILTATEAAMVGSVRRLVVPALPPIWLDTDLRPGAAYLGRLQLYGEQQPNPNNRVRLSRELDALGQQRVRLDWNVSSADRENLESGLRLLGQSLGANGLGRLSLGIPPAPNRKGNVAIPGGHHMGGTRMHASPRQGVVDADCRVHGLGNLYVAGSSIFPTGGFVPPTFTIVALAIRLADHLKQRGVV